MVKLWPTPDSCTRMMLTSLPLLFSHHRSTNSPLSPLSFDFHFSSNTLNSEKYLTKRPAWNQMDSLISVTQKLCSTIISTSVKRAPQAFPQRMMGIVALGRISDWLIFNGRQLTKSLLKRDFGLEVDLPGDRLCPPVSTPSFFGAKFDLSQGIAVICQWRPLKFVPFAMWRERLDCWLETILDVRSLIGIHSQWFGLSDAETLTSQKDWITSFGFRIFWTWVMIAIPIAMILNARWWVLTCNALEFRRYGIMNWSVWCRGTGASCIYPLLGCALRPKWRFVATGEITCGGIQSFHANEGRDIDDKNMEYARKNIIHNNLQDRIRPRLMTQKDSLVGLDGLSLQTYSSFWCWVCQLQLTPIPASTSLSATHLFTPPQQNSWPRPKPNPALLTLPAPELSLRWWLPVERSPSYDAWSMRVLH